MNKEVSNLFSFKRKKSTESQEFDFAKMMAKVQKDPEHLEQVQAHYKKYYHQYPKKSTTKIGTEQRSSNLPPNSKTQPSVNSSLN